MIPKKIHYCWFGPSKMSKLAKKCIESWVRFMPDYEIILWNESNSPMETAYMKRAYNEKKWSNLSNYTRLYALKYHGGWYFDTDVEVIKSPDLTKYKERCFLGLETKPKEKSFLVNNAIIATVPNHPFVVKCFDTINCDFDGTELASLSSPVLTTDELIKIGFDGSPSSIHDIRIFPNDYFYPSSWYEIFNQSMITKNTICIHYNDFSWFSKEKIEVDHFKDLVKNNEKLRFDIELYRSAKISLLELIKINFK
jgi:mannosyltransferase OCH1-like enzyme